MQQVIEGEMHSEIIVPVYGEGESIARWKVDEEEDIEVPWIIGS